MRPVLDDIELVEVQEIGTFDKRVPRSQAIPATVEEAALRIGKRIPNEQKTGREWMLRDATRRQEQRSPRRHA